MHRLAAAPSVRMSNVIRMPMVQNLPASLTQQLQASLMHSDALRRAGTTASNRKCTAPLQTPQRFVTTPSGGVNTPGSMASGGPKMNSRRLVSKTRGQSAGMV